MTGGSGLGVDADGATELVCEEAEDCDASGSGAFLQPFPAAIDRANVSGMTAELTCFMAMSFEL